MTIMLLIIYSMVFDSFLRLYLLSTYVTAVAVLIRQQICGREMPIEEAYFLTLHATLLVSIKFLDCYYAGRN